MANREDVILSAVKFLKDPKVQSSALAKKVAFLESKGLTSAEIEEALSRVNGTATAGAPVVQAGAAAPGPYVGPPVQYTIAPPPPVKSLEWKDYFIAAVVAGGVGYGVYALAKKYISSTFSGPSQAELEAEKKKLDQQFQEASETLNTVKKDTQDVLKHVETQSTEVQTSLESMSAILSQLKSQDTDRDVELKTLREELEKVKNAIPEMLEKQKDTQNGMLGDLQNELKSLKGLLLNRRTTAPSPVIGSSSAPATPADESPEASGARGSATMNIPRPSVPAWQLAASNGTKTNVPNGTEEAQSSSS
ncbi:hypothetical protein K493DRAFT_301906 [Basidiobolus meristosporus CBS 931.73]|uniref:Peroxisomal membrane protein PEX14 n=1 Tax=Basidiobolus meristosporus CBS 931.73 TaxID=1314790 RepID=A0A1Y1YAQ3_9FUNG|nr:hypothetical protein K493DRAFT_301906 [Basidiobolus meristosporus CBS 931.73]|eukprot:ORX94694.1 hypothetical protein K493DRAFT_301906 [Basidiobolus meristosporus CBS 931.73]